MEPEAWEDIIRGKMVKPILSLSLIVASFGQDANSFAADNYAWYVTAKYVMKQIQM